MHLATLKLALDIPNSVSTSIAIAVIATALMAPSNMIIAPI
jgi:hypothetical protein